MEILVDLISEVLDLPDGLLIPRSDSNKHGKYIVLSISMGHVAKVSDATLLLHALRTAHIWMRGT